MTAAEKRRFVALILLGIAALTLKPAYARGNAILLAYAGNFSASFAVYFLARIGVSEAGVGRLGAAALAIAVVEAFEATDGFGVMSNVYDPGDFIANLAGVMLALAVDVASQHIIARRWRVVSESELRGSD